MMRDAKLWYQKFPPLFPSITHLQTRIERKMQGEHVCFWGRCRTCRTPEISLEHTNVAESHTTITSTHESQTTETETDGIRFRCGVRVQVSIYLFYSLSLEWTCPEWSPRSLCTTMPWKSIWHSDPHTQTGERHKTFGHNSDPHLTSEDFVCRTHTILLIPNPLHLDSGQ